MKKYYCLFLFLITLHFNSFCQTWEWTKTAGGPTIDKVTAITNDQSGNIFITGFFDSTIAFDSTHLISAGGTDVFIAKYDVEGVLIWAKQVGGQNDDYASGISTDITGNCYVTGFFFIQGAVSTYGTTTITQAGDADMFISKFSAAGNMLWVRNGGGKNEDASFGITTDAGGNTYVAGYFSGTALFGNNKIVSKGYSDIFVAKYDAAGNLIWIRTGGGAYQDEAYAITTDDSGNCYVTGHFTGNSTFSGQTLSSAGYFDTDVFLLKFNPSGGLVWAKRIGGTANDVGYGIDVSNNGQIFVAGVFKGTTAFGQYVLSKLAASNGFVAKFESNGKHVWSKTTSGTQLNEYRKVTADAAGNCYVAGTISGDVAIENSNVISTGGKDAFIAKYNLKGDLLWTLQGGGIEDDECMTITTDAGGNCYVAGQYISKASFGKQDFSGWAIQDIFISKIK